MQPVLCGYLVSQVRTVDSGSSEGGNQTGFGSNVWNQFWT